MKKREIIHGFRVDNIRHLESIKADIVEMTHVKTLAKLMWLDRDDDNKTFGIAFKTTPTDDTGVFHIMEHCVLNGSDRYPVKEPFVDLLKGSLQTFLNAMTYCDKTVYPVCSRNNKDFINLMRVYLDGVFFPLCVKNENIFRQEGWHYEFRDTKDMPSIKGVVYNEMKGAFSSPERLLSQELSKALFPDTLYHFCSGGDPKAIPTLTYQQFVEAHEKYYSPTNSRIFLDGKMDIDEILTIIDEEYLSRFEMRNDNIAIDYQQPIMAQPVIREYAIAEGEDPKNKCYINFGYVYGDYHDVEKTFAFSILSSILTGTNQSVLKKAILQQNLAEDMDFSVSDGQLQNLIEVSFVNTEKENYPLIKECLENTLKELIVKGIDKEELTASLNQLEFSYKEKDFSGMPKGLVYTLNSLNSWLYGGDPVEGIVFDEAFKNLREKISTNYYEELLKECLLNCKHCGSVILVPSATMESEENQKMAKQMAYLKRDMSAVEMLKLIEMNEQFDQWQAMQDSEEQKATLPKLALSDIDEKPIKVKNEVTNINDIPVIYYDNNTEGIDYYNLYFNIDDLIQHQLPQASLLLNLMSELPTSKHDTLTLNMLRRTYIGNLSVAPSIFNNDEKNKHRVEICVSYSCLDENRDKALQLVLETLYDCIFTDEKAILDMVKQEKFSLQQSVIHGGHQVGLTRAMAALNEAGAVKEAMSGYSYYCYLKDFIDNFSHEKVQQLAELYTKLFTANRLTLSLMGENKEIMANRIIANIRQDNIRIGNVYHDCIEKCTEGIVIASQVSYAELVGEMSETLRQNRGAVAVINKILSLDYLWSTIRAQNGAYGCGAAARMRGLIYYSYRDPSPVKSLEIYRNSDEYLKKFCEGDEDLATYIIGTIGDSEPLLTNSSTMRLGDSDYMNEVTYEMLCKRRKQVLNLTRKQIASLISEYQHCLKQPAICVVGPQETLEKIEGIRLLRM